MVSLNRVTGVLEQNADILIPDTARVTSDYQLSRHEIILVDASNGDINITLPSANDEEVLVYIKKIDSSGNAVNIVTPNNEQIDGQASKSITGQYISRTLIENQGDYFII